ncbi:MAG: glycosyltransferase family 4 protein [Lentisphaeria bacterium]|nr:glycosyltransferase family 4 protein [Lentisphaeria bacterium]
MKLLFFVEHFALSGAGAENDAVQLCQELSRRGHQVHICCDDGEKYGDLVIHHDLSQADDIVQRLQPDRMIDWGFFHPADIVRLSGGLHRVYLEYYARAFPRLFRFVKRASFNLSPKHRRQIALEHSLLQSPDSVFVAISKFVAGQVTASGVPESRVRMIHTGVDTERFSPGNPSTRRKIRAEWGVSDTDTVCLFVAHNLRLKNVALLMDVFDEISSGRPDLKLVVCGKRSPGKKRPYLRFAGTSPRIEEWYQAADLLVHPSFYDSFANVVLEAMACGCPVVVSDCSGVRDLIIDEVNGYVLPVSGANVRETWRKTIVTLADDETLRETLGQKARQTANKNSFDTYVDRFEAVLMEGRHGAGKTSRG